MTDYECLMQIIKSLGCVEIQRGVSPPVDDNQYHVGKDRNGNTEVTIGGGEGYIGFVGSFTFSANGKALNHGIWEE